MGQLMFEPAYSDLSVHRINHYDKRDTHKIFVSLDVFY